MTDKKDENLKVFISYSWSTEQHKQTIVRLAERLVADGVDVVIDVWDLKSGNNVHKFMESMVSSQGITKVLLIVDKEYQAKADAGKGGVGIETEIVSAQIYNKADQNKFIPVVFHYDEMGNPVLPVFLKSRFYIDLSGHGQKDGYEELLRAIIDKPQFIKPNLGKTPAFLQDRGLAVKPSAFFEISQMMKSGAMVNKGYVTKKFFDQLKICIANLIIHDFSGRPEDEVVVEKIQSFREIQEDFDSIFDDLLEIENFEIARLLREFFEFCLMSYSPPEQTASWRITQYAAVMFVTQELLLHVFALMLKKEKFDLANQFIGGGLISKRHHKHELGLISDVYEHLEILDRTRVQRLNLGRASMTADFFKERATRQVSFEDLAQADIVLFLRSEFTSGRWFPRTIVYFDEWKRFDIFLRCEVTSYFDRFSKIIGVKDKADLVAKWEQNKEHFSAIKVGWRPLNFAAVCNLANIATR